nr:hypothetical protein [Tanacetum cinerariifolium]
MLVPTTSTSCTTAETVRPEFVIPEATTPIAPFRCRRLIEAPRWAFARDDLEFRADDVEFRLDQCERGWIRDSARIKRLEEHLGPSRKRCRSPPPAPAVPQLRLSDQSWSFLRLRPQLLPSDVVEAQVAILRGLHGIAKVRILDLEFRAEDVEFRLDQCERG